MADNQTKRLGELLSLNRMPTDAQSVEDPALATRWEQMLKRLASEGNIADDEAKVLIGLFPIDETDSFGLAWTLVHVLETLPGWPLPELQLATGPWAEVLRIRVAEPDDRPS